MRVYDCMGALTGLTVVTRFESLKRERHETEG